MNRRSLIKSLFTIAVAPKVLSELNLEPKPLMTSQMVKELQLLTIKHLQQHFNNVERYVWYGLPDTKWELYEPIKDL